MKIDCMLSTTLLAPPRNKIGEYEDRSGVYHCSKIVRALIDEDGFIGERDELLLFVQL
jgi:hypothetical protein